MTLKGKEKFLRNIIVSLVAVIFVAGITGVVHSLGKSSIRVSYNNSGNTEIWDTNKELIFSKEWFVGTENVELELDLSDYYNDLKDNQESNKEIIENLEGEETEIPPTEEEKLEIPFIFEAYINDYSENNKINQENIQIEEVTDLEENFYGNYKVTVVMPQVEDSNIKFKISIIEGNKWGIPVTEPKIFEIKKDTIAPIVNISGVNNDEQYDKKIATINVDELNIKSTKLIVEKHKLNDDEVEIEEYLNKSQVDIEFNQENDYKIVAYAVDKVGNTSEKKEVSFSINSGAPKVTINKNDVLDIYNTKTLELNIYDNNKIDFSASDYTITKEKAIVETGKFEEKNKKTGVKTIQLVEDGIYDITINAIDKLGTPATINRKIKVDTSNPLITITQVAKEFLTKDDNREITISIEDNDVLNANNIINVTKNGEAYREGLWNLNIEGEKASLSYEFNEEGEYYISVSSTDTAGNSGVSQEVSFKVDLNAPDILIKNADKELINGTFLNETADKNVTITIEDTFLKDTKVTVTKDGEPYELRNVVESPSKMILTDDFTQDGEYIIVVNAEDKAGQNSNKEIKFTVDNLKPEIYFSEELENEIKSIIEDKNYNRDINLVIETKDTNQGENIIEFANKHFNLVDKNVELNNFGEAVKVDNLEVVTLKDILNNEKFADDVEVGSNGKYTLKVKSIDKAGNEAEKEINFIIDKIAPVIDIEKIDYYNQTAKDINVTVNEENFDNEDYKVTVSYTRVAQGEDGDVNEPGIELDKFIATDRVTTVTYGKENYDINGIYTVKVEAVDAAGNVAEVKTLSFVKDSEKPTITFEGLEKGTEYDDKHYNQDVTLNINTSDYNQDVNKLIIKGTYEGKSIFENDELVITEFNEDGNERTLEYTFTEEANYEIEVISIDAAGNESTTKQGEKNIKFTVDKTASIINIENFEELSEKYNQVGKDVIIKVIEENFTTNDVKVSYTKQTPTEDGYNEATSHDLDFKSTEKNCTNTFEGKNFNDEGIYVLTATATDKSKNNAEAKSVTFMTDTNNPKIRVFYDESEKSDDELNANGVHEYYSKKVKVTSYDINQNINNVTITKDGELYQVDGFTTEGRTRTFEHEFTEEGNYVVEVYSKDLSGRESKKTFNFIIDRTKPVITISDFNLINDSFNNPGKDVTVNVHEKNFTYNTVKVTIKKELEDGTVETITPEELLFTNEGEITTHTYSNFEDDAKYTMTISAKDLAGNEAVKENLVLNVTTDTVAPKVEITGVEDTIHYNETKRVTISSYDVNHKVNDVTITKDGNVYNTTKLPEGVRAASISIDFPEEGEYEVALISKDKAGNESKISRTFTIDKTAPVITPVFKGENREIKNGEYINKIFTPEFKLDEVEDKFDFITLNEGNVTGAVPMSSTEMVYHYTGQASDKAGNVTPLDITFTVDVTNPEVKITGIMDGFFSEDMQPEYEITDTNLDNANTSVTLNNKAFESGTKIEEQDYYNLKLLGTDLASNTTARNIVFAIDKDKPVIRFLDEISGKYFTEDFIPNFIIEDLTDYTIIAMTLDGVDYEIGDPITEEGKHVLYIEVKDKAENVESISVEFILDKTPPKFIVNGIKNKEMYVEPVTAEITLENPLDKITGITVNGELAQGDVKEENGQQVIKLNFTDVNDYEVVLKAVDEAGNETEEVISFKIANKNIFTTIYANKTIFYPIIIAIAVIIGIIIIVLVRKNKKEQAQEEDSEE